MVMCCVYDEACDGIDLLLSLSLSLGFQELSGEVEQKRSAFDVLLAACDLLETPFDQSQFESDVSGLQEKMAECDKVCAGRDVCACVCVCILMCVCVCMCVCMKEGNKA